MNETLQTALVAARFGDLRAIKKTLWKGRPCKIPFLIDGKPVITPTAFTDQERQAYIGLEDEVWVEGVVDGVEFVHDQPWARFRTSRTLPSGSHWGTSFNVDPKHLALREEDEKVSWWRKASQRLKHGRVR